MKKKRSGFTLLELLATIAIVGLILGIAGGIFFSTMNNSRDKANLLSEKNIEDVANIYVKEMPDEIIWKKTEDESGSSYSCIFVSLLTEKGYIDEDKLGNVKIDDFVKIIKDSGNNIVSEEIVTLEDEMCGKIGKRVPIPKSEDVCNKFSNAEFEELPLIKNEYIDTAFYNTVKSKNELKKQQPGNYDVEFVLKNKEEGNVWSDGTNENKTVVCTINKKNPNIYFNPVSSGENIKVGLHETTLHSNISGKLYIKISNFDYVNLEDFKINGVSMKVQNIDITKGVNVNASDDIKIILNVLSSRVTSTYVTATVIPIGEDADKYYSGSSIYEIDSVTNITKIDKPTDAYCKENVIYSGIYQDLINVKNDELKGFKFINREHKNARTYQITAKLLPRYLWSDGTADNVVINCSINKRSTDIKLENSSGSEISEIGRIIKDQTITVNLLKGRYKNPLNGNTWTDIPGVITMEVPSEYQGKFEVVSFQPHADYNINTNSKYTANILGKAESGTDQYKIKVKFIPQDTNNYEEKEEYFNLTVIPPGATLTYDATTNGGNACTPNTKMVYYQEPYGTLCTPTKSGYEFVGWYTSPSNRNTKVTENTVLNSLNDFTIYAHFKKRITITLKSYDSSTAVTSTVSGDMYNNATSVNITLPDFSRYKNSCGKWDKIGWSKSTSAGSSKDYSRNTTYSFSSNMTLYARYEIEAIFMYDYNGGKYIPSRYETSYKSGSGSSKNMGPWTETVDQDAKRSGCTFIGWYRNGSLKVKPGRTKDIDFDCGKTYMISAVWGAGCH